MFVGSDELSHIDVAESRAIREPIPYRVVVGIMAEKRDPITSISRRACYLGF